MIETFSIPLAFIIVASLALWIIIGSKGWWILKALAVIFATTFSIFLWRSLDDVQGWPTTSILPNTFEIKWISVDEPNLKTNHPGAIYVWVKDLEPNKSSHSVYLKTKHNNINNEPRLHKMPYTREMHKNAIKIQQKIAKGEKFSAARNGIGTGKGKHPKGNGDNDKDSKNSGSLSQESDGFDFYELPPPVYPQKLFE